MERFAALRICGHTEQHRKNFFPRWYLRWMATSDCQRCRCRPGWVPSFGHISSTDFMKREGLPAEWREDPWLEDRADAARAEQTWNACCGNDTPAVSHSQKEPVVADTNWTCPICSGPAYCGAGIYPLKCYGSPGCPNYAGTEPKPKTWEDWAKAETARMKIAEPVARPEPAPFQQGDLVRIREDSPLIARQSGHGTDLRDLRGAEARVDEVVGGVEKRFLLTGFDCPEIVKWAWEVEDLELAEGIAKPEPDSKPWVPQKGDRVRVRGGGPRTIGWNPDGKMNQYVNRTGKITDSSEMQNGVFIEDWGDPEFPAHHWNWHPDDLEFLGRAGESWTPKMGDTVRVRGDGPKTIRWDFCLGYMEKLVGRTGEITAVGMKNGGVGIEDWGMVDHPVRSLWRWHADDLELVKRDGEACLDDEQA